MEFQLFIPFLIKYSARIKFCSNLSIYQTASFFLLRASDCYYFFKYFNMLTLFHFKMKLQPVHLSFLLSNSLCIPVFLVSSHISPSLSIFLSFYLSIYLSIYLFLSSLSQVLSHSSLLLIYLPLSLLIYSNLILYTLYITNPL